MKKGLKRVRAQQGVPRAPGVAIQQSWPVVLNHENKWSVPDRAGVNFVGATIHGGHDNVLISDHSVAFLDIKIPVGGYYVIKVYALVGDNLRLLGAGTGEIESWGQSAWDYQLTMVEFGKGKHLLLLLTQAGGSAFSGIKEISIEPYPPQ